MYTGKLITRCAAMLLIASAGSVMAVDHQSVARHLPDAAVNAQVTGRLSAGQRLNFCISLPLRNQEALTNLLADLYNPASPKFHHFLSPDQFAAQFGPDPQDYQNLVDFANANGFTVVRTHKNRALVTLSAAASDVERAFGVTMRTYQHPTENRTFHAPDGDLAVHLPTPVLGIHGLSDFEKPQPMCRGHINLQTNSTVRSFNLSPKTNAPAKPLTGSGPSGNYMGYDFRNTYAPNCIFDGTGQSVGLFELEGYYANDISNYVAQAGLPNVNVVNDLVDGVTGIPDINDPNGIVEVSLDIEMAIAMAPGLSKVIVYEGSVPDDIIAEMANKNAAHQLSCSWGFGYGIDPAMNNSFLQMAAQGQTFFQASGDSDAYDNTGNLVVAPVDNPYVTSVGGTTLFTSGAGGSWASEIVWDWGYYYGSYVGSGGGISPNYTIPTWQQCAAVTNNPGNHASTTWRNFPDVSLTADNIYVIAYNGYALTGIGGTSCAAPLWAGFAALVNQACVGNNMPPLGFLNPALYAIGTNQTVYSSAFHDIAVGNNITPTSGGVFSSTPGYDLCTGWGTPNGTNLIAALAKQNVLRILPFTSDTIFYYQPSTGLMPATNTLTLINSGSNSLTWKVNSSTNWLLSTPGIGVLAAGASTTVSVYVDPAVVTNLSPNIYDETLTFMVRSNVTWVSPQTRTVILEVNMPVVGNGGFESSTNISPWYTTGSNSYFAITNHTVSTNHGHVVTNTTGTNLSLFLLANKNNNALYGSAGVSGGNFTHSGTNGFAMGGVGGGNGYLCQPVTTVPNMYYLLSFWLNNPIEVIQNGYYSNLFQVIWNSNVVFAITNMQYQPAWKNYQIVLPQPGLSSSLLQFAGYNGEHSYVGPKDVGTGLQTPAIGAFGIDDVSMLMYLNPNLTPEISGSKIKLTWTGSSTNIFYQLQSSTNLSKGIWTNVGGLLPAFNGTVTTNLIRSGTKNGFYRVLMAAPQGN